MSASASILEKHNDLHSYGDDANGWHSKTNTDSVQSECLKISNSILFKPRPGELEVYSTSTGSHVTYGASPSQQRFDVQTTFHTTANIKCFIISVQSSTSEQIRGMLHNAVDIDGRSWCTEEQTTLVCGPSTVHIDRGTPKKWTLTR